LYDGYTVRYRSVGAFDLCSHRFAVCALPQLRVPTKAGVDLSEQPNCDPERKAWRSDCYGAIVLPFSIYTHSHRQLR